MIQVSHSKAFKLTIISFHYFINFTYMHLHIITSLILFLFCGLAGLNYSHYTFFSYFVHLCNLSITSMASNTIETMHASQCGLHPTKIWISVFSFTFVKYHCLYLFTTVYFLRISVSVTHIFTVLYPLYPIFCGLVCGFSYCGLLWVICFTVHQSHCSNTFYICYILYNHHIYNCCINYFFKYFNYILSDAFIISIFRFINHNTLFTNILLFTHYDISLSQHLCTHFTAFTICLYFVLQPFH